MFIRVLQNDPNWHTLDCLPVPYAVDRKKFATMGGRKPASFQRPGGPDSFEPRHLHLTACKWREAITPALSAPIDKREAAEAASLFCAQVHHVAAFKVRLTELSGPQHTSSVMPFPF